jgi:manganese transport protein
MRRYGILEFLKYVGPGLLVTVGFIDPGNWAANMAAGSVYGYELLWIITLSTLMLIFFQHNAAHLGIATGLCLAEAATLQLKPFIACAVMGTAVLASVSTALAEILGSALALNMLSGGVDIAKFNDVPGDGQRYDIRVKARDGEFRQPSDLNKIYLRSRDG